METATVDLWSLSTIPLVRPDWASSLNMPLSVDLSVILGVPEIGRVIVMKVSEGRWSGPLEHLFLIIRQAILELRARPVAPTLGPSEPILGAPTAHPGGWRMAPGLGA